MSNWARIVFIEGSWKKVLKQFVDFYASMWIKLLFCETLNKKLSWRHYLWDSCKTQVVIDTGAFYITMYSWSEFLSKVKILKSFKSMLRSHRHIRLSCENYVWQFSWNGVGLWLSQAVTVSSWQVWDLQCFLGAHGSLAVRAMHGPRNSHIDPVAATSHTILWKSWLLQEGFTWRCDRGIINAHNGIIFWYYVSASAGKFVRDMLYMAYCDLWSEWSKMTEDQRAGVEAVYGNNCNCKVCGGLWCIVHVRTNNRTSNLSIKVVHLFALMAHPGKKKKI